MIAASGVGANLGGGGVAGGLGAGLSGGVGLLNALALLEDGGGRRGRGRGGGDNSLATMLILSTLINQMVSCVLVRAKTRHPILNYPVYTGSAFLLNRLSITRVPSLDADHSFHINEGMTRL